jgi:hypothetical protein
LPCLRGEEMVSSLEALTGAIVMKDQLEFSVNTRREGLRQKWRFFPLIRRTFLDILGPNYNDMIVWQKSHNHMVDRTTCIVIWGMRILSPYVTTMDFLRRVRRKAEEIRRIDHIFVVYFEKCTWKDTQTLRYPVSLSSLERRSLGGPMAMCCKQLDIYVSISLRRISQCLCLLLFT